MSHHQHDSLSYSSGGEGKTSFARTGLQPGLLAAPVTELVTVKGGQNGGGELVGPGIRNLFNSPKSAQIRAGSSQRA